MFEPHPYRVNIRIVRRIFHPSGLIDEDSPTSKAGSDRIREGTGVSWSGLVD